MKTKRLVLIYLLLGSLIPATALAQSAATAPYGGGAAAERTIEEVVFDSVTIDEAADFLRMAFPKVNCVVSGPSKSVIVDLDLRNVTLKDTLKALELASEGEVSVLTVSDRMILIRVRPVKELKVEVKAFSLGAYLSGKDEKEVERALQELYEILELTWARLAAVDSSYRGERASPNLKIHQSSKLLVVIGTVDQLGVVSEIVGALEEGARSHARSNFRSEFRMLDGMDQESARRSGLAPSLKSEANDKR